MNASEHADLGATSWVQAVRAQLDAAPDHADFYALAGEMAATLSALQDGANVLRRQVARYGEGRDVYDDTRTVDPHARLAEAAELLALLRDADYIQPWFSANRFEVHCPAQPGSPAVNLVLTFDQGGGDAFMQSWGHLEALAAVRQAPTAPAAADGGSSGGTTEPALQPGPPVRAGYVSESNPHTLYAEGRAAEAGDGPSGLTPYRKKNA